MDKKILAEELMEKAYKLIKNYEYRKALSIGAKLRKMRYSGGFEIQAKAYYEDGHLGKAIRVLKEGINIAPNVWLLWNLLGNYLSDDEKYSEAFEAYNTALKCPEVDGPSIYLNIAVVLSREGKFKEALDILEQCDPASDIDLLIWKQEFKTGLLLDLERYNDACILANDTLDKYKKYLEEKIEQCNTLDDDASEILSKLYVNMSRSYLLYKKDKTSAMSNIKKALQYKRRNLMAMRILRELNDKKSSNSNLYNMVVKGKMLLQDYYTKMEVLRPFFTSYQIVAETTEEGLLFAKEYEQRDIYAIKEINIDSYKILEKNINGLKGVYDLTGFAFYEE